MKLVLLKWLGCLFFAVFSFGGSAIAQTNSYPSKPIRMIVPYPAGGATDILARSFGAVASRLLGQQIIVENRTGAGGNIALEAAARSDPDGYTLLMVATSITAINPFVFKSMPADPEKDLTPVAFIASIPNVLVINPSVPANNVTEFITHLKANDKFNFGSNGIATTTRVGWVMFEKLAGVSSLHVVYRGDAPMIIDLIGNTVQASMPTVFTAVPHVRSGALRALGVTGQERSPALPDVPTIAEAGFPEYEATTWFGVTAPKGTPPEIVEHLNQVFNQAVQDPDVQQKLLDLGATTRAMSVSEFSAFLDKEKKKWSESVIASGIKMD